MAKKSETQVVPPKQSKAPIFLAISLGILFVLLFFIIIVPIIIAGIFSANTSEGFSGTGNVAHITISGTILTQTQSDIFGTSSDTSSTKIVKQLERIKNDKAISGVIFEINSPGGSGVASDEISQAIKQLNKPTVSYIREVGASGSYWVASATDYIYANRFSTIGSIGVIASYLDFSEFIERYNVSYQRFVAGDTKDFGSPFREPTIEEEARFQEILDQLHDIFIQEVADGRNMSVSQIQPLADGGIYTGFESVENGLIDGIGGKQEAIDYMETELNQTIKLVQFSEAKSLLDALAGVIQQHGFALGYGLGERLTFKNGFTLRT